GPTRPLVESSLSGCGRGVARVVVKTVVKLDVASVWADVRKGLSYLKIRARTRIRTRDQLIKSQLLYQLSYAGAPAILSSRDLRCVAHLLVVSTPSCPQPARR